MKQQLVDAIRMLERAGFIDHNGHCSARRDVGSFYINSGASVRGALTVNDIVTVDPTADSSMARSRRSSSTFTPRCIARDRTFVR
jgi:ribulose-5-phosphate 4-epimerase/fuculose-1-phosphate aldolase